jgi:hypothetical protein
MAGHFVDYRAKYAFQLQVATFLTVIHKLIMIRYYTHSSLGRSYIVSATHVSHLDASLAHPVCSCVLDGAS